ncbi:MAG: hypothetical protein P4N59_17655 [Negativicutes bacterium]|nr:hypothetical protein [Negativicutes bacterium]
MTGGEFEALQAWQRGAPNRRVEVMLDYRQWEKRLIERIMVMDGERGLQWSGITPAEIEEIDEVLVERSVQAARAAINENLSVLAKLKRAPENLRATGLPQG